LIEICACGEESWVQLAGTTIHELAHVMAGPGVGHSKEWKRACESLGLRRIKAAGTLYLLAHFAPELRQAIAALEHPTDGLPNMGAGLGQIFTVSARPCSHGIGSRGGKSRGPGSGSRMRKFVCGCGVIVRASRDELHARCDDCGCAFTRTDGEELTSRPPATPQRLNA
jgi:hypothetical protein